jgi:LAO/AO transport system kinase
MIDDLIKLITDGDRRAIAKALTIIESTKQSDKKHTENFISKLFAHQSRHTKVIGFSGITGSGKSSLIEEIGKILLKDNCKIAVLAVDPSSPVHGGSILGDKTRMATLSNHQNCFVRPVPSKFNHGGVSRSSREAISIFSAAKYDYIFIETVGVGQTEYSVSGMCDCFILNLLPATGDELQGVKKGINELADIIIINKADGALETQAKLTVNEYKKTLNKPVVPASIYNTDSIQNIINLINNFFLKKIELISKKRDKQNAQWAKSLTLSHLDSILSRKDCDENIENPYAKMKTLLEYLKNKI